MNAEGVCRIATAKLGLLNGVCVKWKNGKKMPTLIDCFIHLPHPQSL